MEESLPEAERTSSIATWFAVSVYYNTPHWQSTVAQFTIFTGHFKNDRTLTRLEKTRGKEGYQMVALLDSESQIFVSFPLLISLYTFIIN